MSLHSLLKAIFGRSHQAQPTADLAPTTIAGAETLSTHHHSQMASAIGYLPEIDRTSLPFLQRYGTDFNAFFYRQNLAGFITQEIIPFKHSVEYYGSRREQYAHFLNRSHWPARNHFSFPGPFYTGESDTCGTGECEAPANVLNDHQYCEFIFRQPQSFSELLHLLDAAAVEVMECYSCDGNDHWTYPLCQEWWRGKDALIERLSSPAFKKNNEKRAHLYLDYLHGAAETDLRKYCYFLENGHYPTGNEPLPPL